jgi:hypothetical protein
MYAFSVCIIVLWVCDSLFSTETRIKNVLYVSELRCVRLLLWNFFIIPYYSDWCVFENCSVFVFRCVRFERHLCWAPNSGFVIEIWPTSVA